MADPARTWALVAGIDVYDNGGQLPALGGAAADAVAAVRWLLGLGLPPAQVLLRVSPCEAAKAAVESLGLPPANVADARFDSITRGLAAIGREGGERLYVFLAGHGVYEPTAGRLFLCQDFGDFPPPDPACTKTIAIGELAKVLLSLRFPEQFLFMDGCQNLPYSPSVRQKFASGLQALGVTPDERANGLVCAFGAAQGELAKEKDGRGAFLGTLLPALDPARFLAGPVDPGLDTAVQLDFETGDRLVFLDLLVTWAKEEIQAAGGTQTPNVALEGRARTTPLPFLRLPAAKTAEVVIDVRPGGAGARVAAMRVTSGEPPGSRLRRSAAGLPIAFPDRFRLPIGAQVMILCTPVDRDTPPRLRQDRLDLTATADTYALAFEFEAQAAAPPPPTALPPGARAIISPRVNLRFADGREAYEMSGDLYRTLQGELGPHPGEDDDIELEHHESGPVFHLRSDAEERQQRAVDLTDQWTRRIATSLGGRGVVTTVAMPPVAQQGVAFRFGAGGAEGLAGRLAAAPTVTLAPVGDDDATAERRVSLRQLAHDVMSLAPGPWRMSLDLPWGSWSRVVNAPVSGVLTVELPARLGTPPLRLAYPEGAQPERRLIFGGWAGRKPPRGSGFEPVATKAQLKAAGLPPGAGRLLVAHAEARTVLVEAAGGRVAFPLFGQRNFAVAFDAPGPRVEPLSNVESPQWDLLVGGGRLEQLTDEQAVDLTNQKWFDELLGLAGAYAVWARSRRGTTIAPEYLGTVLGNLRAIVGHHSPDWELLDVFRESTPSGPLSVEASARLARLAAERPEPLFRWGVPLALALLDRARALPPAAAAWGAYLRQLDAALLPGGAWTAWTPT